MKLNVHQLGNTKTNWYIQTISFSRNKKEKKGGGIFFLPPVEMWTKNADFNLV